MEAARFSFVERTGLGTCLIAEKGENRLGEFRDRLVAAHGVGETDLPCLQPLLAGAGAAAAYQQHENRDCKDAADEAGHDRACHRGPGRQTHIFHVRRP